MQVDVRDSESVAAMVAMADERFGGLDILVNNAGLSHKTGPITELTEDQYNLVMDVNVKGVWLGVKHAVPPAAPPRRGDLQPLLGGRADTAAERGRLLRQ